MSKVFQFIVVNIVMILLSVYIAYYYHNKTRVRSKLLPVTFTEYMNNTKHLKIQDVIIGITFGVVFGFIDNAGLWIGLDTLSQYMPGGVKIQSALGNTYSDLMGSILGTVISLVAKDMYGDIEENAPIWSNTIGILIGCLLGIVFGKVFF